MEFPLAGERFGGFFSVRAVLGVGEVGQEGECNHGATEDENGVHDAGIGGAGGFDVVSGDGRDVEGVIGGGLLFVTVALGVFQVGEGGALVVEQGDLLLLCGDRCLVTGVGVFKSGRGGFQC